MSTRKAEEEQQVEQETKDDESFESGRPIMPAPKSLKDQEDRMRSLNPQASWCGEYDNPWLSKEAAADTKSAILADIGEAVAARFMADSAMAQGKAVTQGWIDQQVMTYELPITEDDVREAARQALEAKGIQVQG